MKFTVYDQVTGRVRRWGDVEPASDVANQPHDGESVLEGEHLDPATEYAPVGVRTPRPVLAFDKTSIAADDADAATLTGLPDPCTVRIDEAEHEVTGGTLAITSPMPATYRVQISDQAAFPAQALDVEITAA